MNNFLKNIDKSAKEIAKNFKDTEVWKRGICCNTCTLAEIETEEYVVFKIYNHGGNKNIHKYTSGELKEAYISWCLDNEKLKRVCEILSKYFIVEIPENENKCILIKEV